MTDWDAWLAERSDLRAARGVERLDAILRLGGPRHGLRDALDLASNDYLGLVTGRARRGSGSRGPRPLRRVGDRQPSRDGDAAGAPGPRGRALPAGRAAERPRLLHRVCRQPRSADRVQWSRGGDPPRRPRPCVAARRSPHVPRTVCHLRPQRPCRPRRRAGRPARPEGRRRRRVDLLRPRRCRSPARPRRGLPPPRRPARRRRGARHRGGRARARSRPRARPRRRPRPRRHA